MKVKGAVNRVWSAFGVYVQALSFLLALFFIFNVAAPHASAATLTSDQKTSILNLLSAFDADQATIARVQAALGVDDASAAGMSATTSPTCMLVADSGTVQAGGQVTLSWASSNAAWASMPDGSHGKTQGSITLPVNASTTFVKRVYGPGGEGSCSATVLVGGTAGATAQATSIPEDSYIRLAPVPAQNSLSNILSNMQTGAAILGEAYLNWFNSSPQ